MDPREFERRLKRKELAPVLFLWGEESLLIDDAIRQIEAMVLEPATREFNRDLFYGDDVDVQAILTAAQTLPWMASQRLVLVRGCEALPRSADALLVRYCKQPSPSTCLIFTAQRIDPGRPLFATLAKMPWAVRFRRLLPRELAAWVERRVSSLGGRITPDAVAALGERIGTDLQMLASELDKLVTFVGDGQAIDIESLAAVSGDIRETSAFELARFLAAGDLGEALRAWRKFSSSGEYPGLALGAIIHHLRQVWRVKLAQQSGAPLEHIARDLNIPLFSVRRLSAQAAALQPEHLIQWLEALFEADQTLKRSGRSPQSVFEGLILQFCLPNRTSQEPA